MGLSSPISRFARTLLAGNPLGVMLSNIRRRELVTTRDVMETSTRISCGSRKPGNRALNIQRFWSLRCSAGASSIRLPTFPIMMIFSGEHILGRPRWESMWRKGLP